MQEGSSEKIPLQHRLNTCRQILFVSILHNTREWRCIQLLFLILFTSQIISGEDKSTFSGCDSAGGRLNIKRLSGILINKYHGDI